MTGPLRARRNPVPAVVLAVIGLLVIGVAQGVPNRHSIERSLTSRSTRALQAAGLPAEVTFTGRDGVVRVAAADADQARKIVLTQEGVRVVHVVTPAGPDPAGPGPATPDPAVPDPAASGPASPGPSDPAALAAPSVTITVTGGRASLSGAVASDAIRSALVDAAKSVYGQGAVDDRLTVQSGIGDAGISGLGAVLSGLGKGTATATVELVDNRITLTGTASSAAAKAAAVNAAQQSVGTSGTVVDRLTVPDPAANANELQTQLKALPQITFENDSTTLTPQGRAAVQAAANILNANPGRKVQVEGHTDNSGTRLHNIDLSQRRAKQVVKELQSLGVPGNRLAFFGYGSSRPKVPGDSPASRAINRRVEFVVT